MKNFQGITVRGMSPGAIGDGDLLTQIITLSRIWFFLLGNEGVKILPDVMKRNYGDLLCGSELDPLIAETYRRSAAGSEACREFLIIAGGPIGKTRNRSAKNLKKLGSTEKDIVRHMAAPFRGNEFIIDADRIAAIPSIRSRYYRPIVLEADAAPKRDGSPLPEFSPAPLAL